MPRNLHFWIGYASRLESEVLFAGSRARLLLAVPKVKCVSENYVAEEIVLRTIVDVECGIELEIPCDVAGETDRR